MGKWYHKAIAGAAGGLIFGPKIYNAFWADPYGGVRRQIEQQYNLADLMGQREMQGQLARANRIIGARLASVGSVDPMGYAGQAASDAQFRALADLRAQLSQGRAAALADILYRSANFRNQAQEDLWQSVANIAQTVVLGGLGGLGGGGQGPFRDYDSQNYGFQSWGPMGQGLPGLGQMMRDYNPGPYSLGDEIPNWVNPYTGRPF